MRSLRFRVPEPSADWDAAVDAFLFHCQRRNLSEGSPHWYRQRVLAFAEFAKQRHETPQTFSTETVGDFLHQLQQRRLTPQTINGYRRALHAFASFLQIHNYREDNPVKRIPKLQEPQLYPRTLSDEQLLALLALPNTKTFVGLRDKTLMLLLAETGLRIGEACALTLSDVDIANGFLRVRHGKGNKERWVPLGYASHLILQRYLAVRSQLPLGTDVLFVSAEGRPLSRRVVLERFYFYASKLSPEVANGVRISPHTLRFTFVRRWLQRGGDSIILQRILGHSSPAMTAYYARLFATDLKAAYQRLNLSADLLLVLDAPARRLR